MHRFDRGSSTYLRKTTFSKVMDFLPRLDEIQAYEQVFLTLRLFNLLGP
jgi:hypothetical protein